MNGFTVHHHLPGINFQVGSKEKHHAQEKKQCDGLA